MEGSCEAAPFQHGARAPVLLSCSNRPALSTTQLAPLTNKDQYSDKDGERIKSPLDPRRLLEVEQIIGVAREKGIWTFRVRFKESKNAPPSLLDGYLIGDRPLSEYAASLDVTWKPQWVHESLVPKEHLLALLDKVSLKLAALLSPEDDFVWRMDASIFVLGGRAFHLCTEPNCSQCVHLVRQIRVDLPQSVGDFHYLKPEVDDDSRRKSNEKVKELTRSIWKCSNHHYPGNVEERVQMMCDIFSILSIHGPVRQLRVVEDNISECGTEFEDLSPMSADQLIDEATVAL